MRKLFLLFILLLPSLAQAQIRESISGYCERGGETVSTDGRQSTTKVQRTFTSCTVTIYLSGSTTLATIFPGNSGTATKSNPFVADTDGYWQAFVAPGRYDVRFSGAGITSPFTRSGYWVSSGGASALPSCTTAQMLYYAAAGATPACLTLGTNLSISGGILNATGGGGGGGAGSVTSVGLALPDIFSVANSPVTTVGTLTATLQSQAQRLVFASPSSSTGLPTFRSLVIEDIPGGLPYAALGPITTSGLTVSAQNRLLGRFSSGSGAPQELTLGGGLTIENGGVLNTTNSGLTSSVNLTLPVSIFTVTGGGTGAVSLAGTFNTQQAKRAFMGPISGAAAVPTFRLLQPTDIPNSPNAYNVKTDFGCVGDGVANDTDCLSAAFAAAAGSGGLTNTVYIPQGTYLTDPITQSLDGLVIYGDGQFNSIIKARQAGTNSQVPSSGSVFYLTNAGTAHRLVLRDLAIHGAGKAAGSFGHCLYINDAITYLQGFEFSNLDIRFCRQTGIFIPTIFSGVIRNVHTDEIGGNHFDLGADANTVTLIGNYIHTVDSGAVGFRLRGGAYTLIGNNGMDPDSATTARWGVFGSDTSDGDSLIAYFTGVMLGNNIEDFGDVGIFLKAGSKLGSVSNNSFSNRDNNSTHIAIQFANLDGFPTPAGIWDTTNRITLIDPGANSWMNFQPIHSRGVPFFSVGGDPGQYHDTFLLAATDLPGTVAANDGFLGKMFNRSVSLQAENLKVGRATADNNVNNAQHALIFESRDSGGSISRVTFRAVSGSTNSQPYLLPTSQPTENGQVLSSTTSGTLSWGARPAVAGAIGSSLLQMSTARLLGRYSANTGAIQEITIGNNLSLDVNGVLSSTGGTGATPAGTGTELQYRLNGTTFGAVSSATSDGTNLTITSGALRATSPRITTSVLDSNGNSILALNPVASSVNRLAISNSTTSNWPEISVEGSDTHISLALNAKGTDSSVQVLRPLVVQPAFVNNQPTSATLDIQATLGGPPGQIRFFGNNSTNFIAIRSNTVPNGISYYTLPASQGLANQFLQNDGNGNLSWAYASGGSGGGGTVTSVGLFSSSTNILTVSSSGSNPIQFSGNFTINLANQSANTVFASPTDGSTGTPIFRKIVAADIQGTLTQNTTGSAGSLSSTLSIAGGGTGATTASAARSALSAAASGANSDITSLSGLTTAISIAQGGTGATTAAAARSNLGVPTLEAPTNGSGLPTNPLSRYNTSSSLGSVFLGNGLQYATDVNGNVLLINSLTQTSGTRTFYATPAGSTGGASFRTIQMSDLAPNPSGSLYLRGDGTWGAPAGSGTVTQISTGTGLTGGPITSTGTISLATTGVAANTYTTPSSITVNAQGQITAIASGSGGGGGANPAGSGNELQFRLTSTSFGASHITSSSTASTAFCSSPANCFTVAEGAGRRISFNASGIEAFATSGSTVPLGRLSWSTVNSVSSLEFDLYDTTNITKGMGLNCASPTLTCTLDIGSYGTANAYSGSGRIRLHNNSTVNSATTNAAVVLTAFASNITAEANIDTQLNATGSLTYGLYLPYNQNSGSSVVGGGVWWMPGSGTNFGSSWAGFWFGRESTAGGGFNFQGFAKDTATGAATDNPANLNVRATNGTSQGLGAIHFQIAPGRSSAGNLRSPTLHGYRRNNSETATSNVPMLRLWNSNEINATASTTIAGAISYDMLTADSFPAGTLLWCTNCVTPATLFSACTAGGSGAFAVKNTTGWRCF